MLAGDQFGFYRHFLIGPHGNFSFEVAIAGQCDLDVVFSGSDQHGTLYATELVHVSGIVAVNEYSSPVRSYFEFHFSGRICIDGVGILLHPHGHDMLCHRGSLRSFP